MSEEYVVEQSITMGDSNLQTLREKYKTLIDNTIKQFEIPKEEPELTEILQYFVENARNTSDKFLTPDKEKKANETKADNWISGAMYSRLEFLKGLYPTHPIINLYNAKLGKQKTIKILIGAGIAVLVALYLIFFVFI